MRRAGFAAAVVVLAGCGGPEMSGPKASCADPSPITTGAGGTEVVGRGRGG